MSWLTQCMGDEAKCTFMFRVSQVSKQPRLWKLMQAVITKIYDTGGLSPCLSACLQKCERLTLLILSNVLSAPFQEPVSPLVSLSAPHGSDTAQGDSNNNNNRSLQKQNLCSSSVSKLAGRCETCISCPHKRICRDPLPFLVAEKPHLSLRSLLTE